MPPLRSAALTAAFIVLAWLVLWQVTHDYTQVMAQSNPGVVDAVPFGTENTLAIELRAENDSPKSVGAPVTLRAIVVSGNVPGLTFSWNFGDGKDGTLGQVVQHSYENTGTFFATVIARNGTESASATTTVWIVPPTPMPTTSPIIKGLRASGDQLTDAGNPTRFVATIEEGADVIYEWDFGDNSPALPGSSVSHIYQIPGQYTARVRAYNSYGEARAEIAVKIQDAPPSSPDLLFVTSTAVNTWNTYTATVASGTNVEFEWRFSDGHFWRDPVIEPLRRTSTYRYRFNSARSHTVTVIARNIRREISTAKTILVRDTPPTLLSILLPTLIGQGVDNVFTGIVRSASRVQATWYWGDGTMTTTESSPEQDSLTNKEIEGSHKYPTSGRFFMQVHFQNTGGWVAGNQIVRVNLLDPQSNTTIIVSPLPRVGEPVTFSLADKLEDPSCTWYFGHNTTTVPDANTTISYPYREAGFYVVHALCTERKFPNVSLDYEAETPIYVRGNLFMPVAGLAGDFAIPLPQGTALAINVTPPLYPTPVPPTNTPTVTPLPTNTPTETATATATRTPILTATMTPIPLPTDTPTPTATLVVIETATPTATETIVDTPTPTETATETATPTATETPFNGTIPQP